MHAGPSHDALALPGLRNYRFEGFWSGSCWVSKNGIQNVAGPSTCSRLHTMNGLRIASWSGFTSELVGYR